MIELGCSVTLDGNRHGLVVGRGFDPRRKSMVYDVRVFGEQILLYLEPPRLNITGPCPHDVIGRDIPHNPRRPHLLESADEQRAA
jgi:hypothetical protein